MSIRWKLYTGKLQFLFTLAYIREFFFSFFNNIRIFSSLFLFVLYSWNIIFLSLQNFDRLNRQSWHYDDKTFSKNLVGIGWMRLNHREILKFFFCKNYNKKKNVIHQIWNRSKTFSLKFIPWGNVTNNKSWSPCEIKRNDRETAFLEAKKVSAFHWLCLERSTSQNVFAFSYARRVSRSFPRVVFHF